MGFLACEHDAKPLKSNLAACVQPCISDQSDEKSWGKPSAVALDFRTAVWHNHSSCMALLP